MNVQDKIQLASASDLWPKIFLEVQTILRQILGEHARRIENFGSTSIPGIKAKPIIDVLCEVTSIAAIDKLKTEIEAAAFCWLGENGLAGRRYLVLSEEIVGMRSHVHVFAEHDPNSRDRLRFRDALIKDPSLAQEYEALKLELQSRFANDPVSSWQGRGFWKTRYRLTVRFGIAFTNCKVIV